MESRTHSPGEELLDAVGPAFSRLSRTTALNAHRPISRRDLARVRVLQTVLEASETGGIAVGDVAERLTVDPSTASRMVSGCITAGYLQRAVSQRDGRRALLRLTPEGTEMLNDFRRHQRAAYERITRDWPASERLEFARLLLKYVDALTALSGSSEVGR